MEYRRPELPSHRAATVLSNVVVSDAGVVRHGRVGGSHLATARLAAAASARRAASLLAGVDRLSRKRAKTYRCGAARQPRSAAGYHQEPGADGVERSHPRWRA